jgi:putative two-component system response regulator
MDETRHEFCAARILVVDDEEPMRRLLGRSLEAAGYSCTLAADAAEALARLAEAGYELLLCDVNLPDQSGLDLVRHALTQHLDTAALMLSGSERPDYVSRALDNGAYGYLVKPFTFMTVRIAVMNALRRRELEMTQRAQLERTIEQLEASRSETVHRLSRAMEYRDPGTGEHVERMSRYCALVARHFSLDAASVGVASAMHDIGKIGVPDSILLKSGPLTAEERCVMQTHAAIGHELLSGSDSEILRLAATIAWTHHERYDGGGYPRGLTGDEIPLEGKIAAVADVFDALTSTRPYREALSVDEALGIMRAERGRHFDPLVLDAFIALLDDVDAVRREPPGWRIGALARA